MASTASTSQEDLHPRPQAGPLPSKRGEIGYVEGVSPREEVRRSSSPEVTLPERHPADRDPPSTFTATTAALQEPNSAPSVLSATHTLVSPSSTTLASSTESQNSTSKPKKVLFFFNPKKVPTLFGFRLTTFSLFVLQSFFIVGTIIGWVFSAKYTSRKTLDGFSNTGIFVHVIFGVSLLAQLLFLERRIFRLRAERYSYLHPGEILPSARANGPRDSSIAFAPWSRPPLPTYAAALSQSGAGTGDVEDHLIAAPPPPAYGHTRGSTLLLAGFLRDSLRAQRPVSERSQMTQQNDSRPISYRSRDEQWDEIQDAERARQLEETLARLERPGSRSAR